MIGTARRQHVMTALQLRRLRSGFNGRLEGRQTTMITARIAVASALLAARLVGRLVRARPPARPHAAGADRRRSAPPPRSAASIYMRAVLRDADPRGAPGSQPRARPLRARIELGARMDAHAASSGPPLRRGGVRQRRPAARHRGVLDARRARRCSSAAAASSRSSTSAICSAPRRGAAAAKLERMLDEPGRGGRADRRARDAGARGAGALRASRGPARSS